MANLIEVSSDDLKLLYSLYEIQMGKKVTISFDHFINFLLNQVITDPKYAKLFDEKSKSKLQSINIIIQDTKKHKKYSIEEMLQRITPLANNIDKNTLELLYIYYGSINNYREEWTLTIEEFIEYLNSTILPDKNYSKFISKDIEEKIKDGKTTIADAKDLLVSNTYHRGIMNTTFDLESEETFAFIKDLRNKTKGTNVYVIGDSPMALEMSESFNKEMNLITILTMIFIFIVVAFTFKSLIIPVILVLIIQCAVYITMDIITFTGGSVYFIALLIVQSILMGATIDYAILYTSYYMETRKTMPMQSAIIASYNKSIHTILTSASILIVVTLIVGNFASSIASMICKTISIGTLCSMILMLIILPSLLACADKFIIKDAYQDK